MSLKRKDVDILNYINNNEKTLSEISTYINTCERNLRYIIDNLNFYLEKILFKRIIKNKKKLSISLTNKELDSFFSIIYKDYYSFDQDERAEYILMQFLFFKNVKLTSLEEKLSISRATLKKDITFLNELLKNMDLELILEKNKFILTGKEKKLRQLKTFKYLDYYNLNLSWLNVNELFSEIDVNLLKNLENLIDVVEKKFNLIFNSNFKNLILFFLYVTLERIENRKIITTKFNYDFLINTTHYNIIKDVFKDYIDSNLVYELVHLTEYFISGGVRENLYELEEATIKFVDNLIFILQNNLNIVADFNTLKNRLIEYLIPAIYRLRNNFTISESLEKNEYYSLVYDYSQKDKFLPEKLLENEIIYIAHEIELAISKEQLKVIDLNLLISIIEKNSTNLNKSSLINDLNASFGHLIKK